MKQIKRRYEIECSASNTVTRYAGTLRGILRHLSRMQGRASILDRKTDRIIFEGSPERGYDMIRIIFEIHGRNEDETTKVILS